MSHVMRVSTPLLRLTTSKVYFMYSWWQDGHIIKTLKSNRGAGCELQIMGLKKRNVVQRIHKLYELKLHHSVVQQLSKYVTCLSICSFFHVWMTFSLLCIKVCHFHQAMCFLLLFFLPQHFDFSLEWGNVETDAGTTKRT